ncbi:MAG TPA: hypothetical protein VE616_19325 [Candidatus Udaeobacter sp.]|jgi:hypothetical protein|nr:hypothetical protein [Candidatus Udaeobacter sp.]
MTFQEVLAWCRAHQADVRGVYRGKDISISHTDDHLPDVLPSIGEIFHWDLRMRDLHHPVSASDFERIVAGKMTIEGFKSTLRGAG